MKKTIIAIIMTALLLAIILGTAAYATDANETEILAVTQTEVPTNAAPADNPALPKGKDGCEYIPDYISIWDVTITDENGTPYEDITTESDRAQGNRRLALELPDGTVSGIIIRGEDRAVIHYQIAGWHTDVTVGE